MFVILRPSGLGSEWPIDTRRRGSVRWEQQSIDRTRTTAFHQAFPVNFSSIQGVAAARCSCHYTQLLSTDGLRARAPFPRLLQQLLEDLRLRLAEEELAQLAVPPRHGRTQAALQTLLAHHLGHALAGAGGRAAALEVVGLADDGAEVDERLGRVVLAAQAPLARRVVRRVLVAAISKQYC